MPLIPVNNIPKASERQTNGNEVPVPFPATAGVKPPERDSGSTAPSRNSTSRPSNRLSANFERGSVSFINGQAVDTALGMKGGFHDLRQGLAPRKVVRDKICGAFFLCAVVFFVIMLFMFTFGQRDYRRLANGRDFQGSFCGLHANVGGVTKEENALSRWVEMGTVATTFCDDNNGCSQVDYPQWRNVMNTTSNTLGPLSYDSDTAWEDEFKQAWFSETSLEFHPYLLYSVSGVQLGDSIYEKMLSHKDSAVAECKENANGDALNEGELKACRDKLWEHRKSIEQSLLSSDNLHDRGQYGIGSSDAMPWLAQFNFQPVCVSELPKADFLNNYVDCWKGYLHGRSYTNDYADGNDATKTYNVNDGQWGDDSSAGNKVDSCRVYQHFVDGPSKMISDEHDFVVKNLGLANQVSEFSHGNHKFHNYPDYHPLLTFPALPKSICPYDPEFCVWFPPETGLDFVVVDHYKTNVQGESTTSDADSSLCQGNLCGGFVHPARREETGLFDLLTVARAQNVTFTLWKHGLLYDLEDEVPSALLDFYSARYMFLFVSVGSAFVGVSYVMMMSAAIAPVVLTSIVGVFLFTVVGAVLLLMKSEVCFEPGVPGSQGILGGGNGETDCDLASTIFLTPAEAQRTHLRGLGIFCMVVVGCYLLACGFLAKRIKLGMEMRESAMQFVRDARFLFLIPFFQVMFLLIWWFFWLVTMAFVFADPKNRPETHDVVTGTNGLIANAENFDAQSWFRVGRAAPMRKTCLADDCLDLLDDPILEGIFLCNLPRVSLVKSTMYVAALFFALIWLNSFVTAFGHCLISGIVGLMYFKHKSVFWPVFSNLCLYHVGSIAQGALLFMVMKIIRGPMWFVWYRSKITESEFEIKILECFGCFAHSYSNYVQYWHKIAYPMMVYSGDSLYDSGKTAMQLLRRNEGRLNMWTSSGLNVVGTSFLAAFTVFVGYFVLVILHPMPSKYSDVNLSPDHIASFESVRTPFGSIILYMIMGYVIGKNCINLFRCVVDSVLTCFLMDEEMNGGIGHAKYAPAALSAFIDGPDFRTKYAKVHALEQATKQNQF